ncbi:MAG: glycosyltransferase family 2 protein [Pseudobutyrivibrio sp.]|nr:glycosyltransferase family 2 protein [Pseudobutyrivibrio sp.]
MPLVSIIVPAYNCEKYIKECIQSICNQSYSDIEIIAIDDGSSDGTLALLKDCQKSDERIRIIHQNNSGVAVARNEAIAQAQGDYLMFVDGDDYVDADYVEQFVTIARESESELVIGGYSLCDSEGKKFKEVRPGKYEAGRNEISAYCFSCVCGRLVSRHFWDKNGLSFCANKEQRAEDVPIALFCNAMAKNICVIPYCGYGYRQHSESVMHQKVSGPRFKLPYESVKDVYGKLKAAELVNSKDFFYIGVLKFFAQMYFVIYLKASKEEKQRLLEQFYDILGDDAEAIKSVWQRYRWRIKLPITHKAAMELMGWKLYSLDMMLYK